MAKKKAKGAVASQSTLIRDVETKTSTPRRAKASTKKVRAGRNKEKDMDELPLSNRVGNLERQLAQIIEQLDGLRSPTASATAPAPGPPPPEALPAISVNLPGAIALSQFSGQIDDLSLADRQVVVTAAIRMLEGVFAHLPLKKAMHGIDPVQRLKLLQRRVQDELNDPATASSAPAFHAEMIDVFHSLRDLHTNYILPSAYQRMTAFLPFLIQEYYSSPPRHRHYIVTRTHPLLNHPTFVRGVTIVSWNGIPIDRAVEIAASREAGSNEDARHVRGLESLTLRSLARDALPDEEWVIIRYVSNGQELEIKFNWMVSGTAAPTAGLAADSSGVLINAGQSGRLMGFDGASISIQRAKKTLFFPDQVKTEERMAAALHPGEQDFFQTAAAPSTVRRPRSPQFGNVSNAAEHFQRVASTMATDNSQTTSLLPEFFSFQTLNAGPQSLGYIRIYSFMAWDTNAFVAEFIRIAQLLPQTGLIIDVRGNGGGNINAGEMLLQVLTKTTIEPERFHFINSPETLDLCTPPSDLSPWKESIKLSLETGEIYSQGFPLTSPSDANSGLWGYTGKVLLLIDALCYSTTDIFSAGFQDHEIGKILGTTSRTGAGGANVWGYDFLQGLDGFPPLPKGVAFRTAIRRATRVRGQAGVPLEDLGVKTNEVHYLTRRDLLEGNADLLARAAELLFSA
jgi:hypothetical protein